MGRLRPSLIAAQSWGWTCNWAFSCNHSCHAFFACLYTYLLIVSCPPSPASSSSYRGLNLQYSPPLSHFLNVIKGLQLNWNFAPPRYYHHKQSCRYQPITSMLSKWSIWGGGVRGGVRESVRGGVRERGCKGEKVDFYRQIITTINWSW